MQNEATKDGLHIKEYVLWEFLSVEKSLLLQRPWLPLSKPSVMPNQPHGHCTSNKYHFSIPSYNKSLNILLDLQLFASTSAISTKFLTRTLLWALLPLPARSLLHIPVLFKDAIYT